MTQKGVKNRRKSLQLFFAIILCIIVIFCSLFIAFSKKPSLSSEDIIYINAFLKDWKINTPPAEVHKSFENEIAFISTIQDSIIAQVCHKEIQQSQFGNIHYYYLNKQGMCYDRTVLLEKIFLYYDFSFRHIFIYFLDNNKEVSFLDFFKKGTGSHALTEVKTSKGWMAIGSNADWIGLNPQGQPFTIQGLQKGLSKNGTVSLKEQPMYGPIFWKQHPHFRYIYGVYSRHGNFLPPHIGIPDYNWRMLLYNL